MAFVLSRPWDLRCMGLIHVNPPSTRIKHTAPTPGWPRRSELLVETIPTTFRPRASSLGQAAGRDLRDVVLVLGGNGFVGSAAAKAAVQAGYDVISLSRRGAPASPGGEAWEERVRWLRGDLVREPEEVRHVLAEVQQQQRVAGVSFHCQSYRVRRLNCHLTPLADFPRLCTPSGCSSRQEPMLLPVEVAPYHPRAPLMTRQHLPLVAFRIPLFRLPPSLELYMSMSLEADRPLSSSPCFSMLPTLKRRMRLVAPLDPCAAPSFPPANCKPWPVSPGYTPHSTSSRCCVGRGVSGTLSPSVCVRFGRGGRMDRVGGRRPFLHARLPSQVHARLGGCRRRLRSAP